MATSIFKKKKKEPSLFKIIVVIVAIGAAGYGVFTGSRWFTGDVVSGAIESDAPVNLDQAQALLDEGKVEEARKVLRPITARAQDPAIAVPALQMMAKAASIDGNADEELALLEKAATAYPASAIRMQALLDYARALESAGRLDEAYKHYEQIKDTAPPEIRAAAYAALGRRAERAENEDEALTHYSAALADAEFNTPAFFEALEGIGPINVRRLFSPEKFPGSKYYEVKPGDNLTAIGVTLNTTQGLLMRANNMDSPNRLRVGQRLKYTPKDFRIVIDIEACRLYLCDNDGPFKVYRTGLGKPGHETVPGEYKIGSKQVDPVWFPPDGGRIEAGDPRNQLGTRWMPLVPLREGLPDDLGIHGAVDPATVGTFSSNGCARLHMKEVEELYDLVVRSTPVRIVESATRADLM
jgi:lipoprotein-anchoring transpeptidase ErfK/SrfK/soluble cytochrome b562